MGVVYRARDRVLDRTVAVKVLPAELAANPTLVERFEREARAAAKLSDPHIVAVFDTGRDPSARYIVMELVAGVSLAELLHGGGALPVSRAVEIAAQIADALAAAHAAGIIHRDVKPGNVMIDRTGAAKVLDFGIARARSDDPLTRTTVVLGSAPYISPEVALGGVADERSDIYSLGCVLYEMLAGRPPFTGELPAAVMHQQASAAPIPPRDLAPATPPGLDALVMQMLAKRPEDRPPHAGPLVPLLRDSLRAPVLSSGTSAAHASAPALEDARSAAAPAAKATAGPAASTPPAPPRRVPRGTWIAAVLAAVAALAGVALALVGSPGPGSSTSSSVAGSRTSTPAIATSSPSITSTSTARSASTATTSTQSTKTTSTQSTTTSSPTKGTFPVGTATASAPGTPTSKTAPATSSVPQSTAPAGATSTGP